MQLRRLLVSIVLVVIALMLGLALGPGSAESMYTVESEPATPVVESTRVGTPTQVKRNATSWGYAADRNAARLEVIEPWLRSALSQVCRTRPHQLTGIDFGADQGYFSVELAKLLRSVDHCDAHVVGAAQVFAVEKGGPGGTLWSKTTNATSILVSKLQSLLPADVEGYLCPTEVDRATFTTVAPQCQPSVQFVLSMLHWVRLVDGVPGLCQAVCGMIRAAAVTVLELPHPRARRTYGESRYRGWYRYESNLTKLLEGCVVKFCPRCSTVTWIGQTPWGKGLFRELFALSNPCWLAPTEQGSTAACLRGLLGCRKIARTV